MWSPLVALDVWCAGSKLPHPIIDLCSVWASTSLVVNC